MSATPSTSELHHRSHEQLLRYWESRCAGREFPAESDISPDDLEQIWSSCFLICLDEVTRKIGYRYSYLGESLIEAYGDDLRNPDVAARLLSTSSAPLIQKFDEVVESRKPLIDESDFVNLKGLRIKYRSCVLPLGREGVVTHILGCMRWRIY